MIRPLAVAATVAFAAVAAPAAAQTWGQPVYVSPWGHAVGGAPLSEVETRAYVATGRWADGYSDQAYVYAPAPVYGYGRTYGYGRYDHDRRRGDRDGYGYGRRGYGYGHGGHEPRPLGGYRDVWGYNDDRPPASRGEPRDRGYEGGDRRDCGCPDVYLYDR